MYFATYKGTGIEYLIVILLLFFSGSVPFTGGLYADELLIGMFVFLTALLLMRKRPILTVTGVTVGFLFLTILLVQSVSFAFLPLRTIAGFMIRLFIGYAAVSLVENFPRVYINVLFYTCILSLFFYVSDNLFAAVGYDFPSLFAPIQEQVGELFVVCCEFDILMYNFQDPSEAVRNAAFFWEPGAFAGYILLALILLGLKRTGYEKQFYWTRFIVLVVTLLTTLSTMGFIVLPFVLALHYRPMGGTAAAKLGWFSVIVLLLPLLGTGALKVWEAEFLERKVVKQYEITIDRGRGWQTTRFGTLLFDWKYIKRRPTLGWGLHEKTRFVLNPGDSRFSSGQGNGLSDFIHKFGFLGMAIFVLFTWKGLFVLSGNSFFRSSLGMLAIALSLNGEVFLAFPLFMGLMFLEKAPGAKREGVDIKSEQRVVETQA